MVRKLFHAAKTGVHSVNQVMDREEAARQLLELASYTVNAIDRLFWENKFDATAAGFGSKDGVKQMVTLASSVTRLVECIWKFNEQDSGQILREVTADLDEFPVMHSGLRRVMAERRRMLEDLKLGSTSPFKEEDGKGPGMANDEMRHLIQKTYLEIQNVRLWSGKLSTPNTRITKTIRKLPQLTLETYKSWAPVMAEIASTWGGEESALNTPGTWLYRLGSPNSATTRNTNRRRKKISSPLQKIVPSKESRANRKKLLAGRIKDRLEDILKPLPMVC